MSRLTTGFLLLAMFVPPTAAQNRSLGILGQLAFFADRAAAGKTSP